KLPDSVPPAVSKAFAAIIPATVALYAIAIFYWVFSLIVPDLTFLDWLQETVALPLLGLSQGFGAVAITTLFVQLFWFFGIQDRKSTRLNSSHVSISYAVFCLKKKINKIY